MAKFKVGDTVRNGFYLTGDPSEYKYARSHMCVGEVKQIIDIASNLVYYYVNFNDGHDDLIFKEEELLAVEGFWVGVESFVL